MKKLILLILIAGVIAVPALIVTSCGTAVEFAETPIAVGTETPLVVKTENPHGVRRLTAYMEQHGKRYPMHEETAPGARLTFWRKSEEPREFRFTAGKNAAPELKEGPARMVVEVVSNDLLGRTDVLAADVVVNTQPLRLVVDDKQHYINQGGSELVTFRVSGYWTEAGVRVGPYTFRSFPMPGTEPSADGSAELLSLFAFPWDLPASTVPVVYAKNPTGAEVTGRFWHKVFPKRFRARELPLSDAFLDKIVNQIEPGGSGDLLSRFLKINGEMRQENNQKLADLRHQTEERFLWNGAFLQLSNSKVESQFADVRSYMYNGKKVDQQVHLGFDLSVIKNVDVVASNDGKVIYADDLGIYGNCVVVDHGFGLQSIYAHLSEISVKPGDLVSKRQILGKSGDTGLAGGDHLHYSMQVDGVQVNPVEWWDAHWIQDRILTKVPAAAGMQASSK